MQWGVTVPVWDRDPRLLHELDVTKHYRSISARGREVDLRLGGGRESRSLAERPRGLVYHGQALEGRRDAAWPKK